MPLQPGCLLPLLLLAALRGRGADQPRPPAAPAPRPAPASSSWAARLRPVRANFQRISAIRRWSSTATRDLDEPGEGGEATFYYARGRLEKVVARHFGEMSQQRVEYYLLRGQPSFVLEKTYSYNRPIYLRLGGHEAGARHGGFCLC